MAEKQKQVFIAEDWCISNLKQSDRWKDPATGIRGSAYYMMDNGLSKSFTTDEGHFGVIINKPKPNEQEPPTIMVQIPNGLSMLEKLPEQMYMHKTTLILMPVEDYQKLSAKASKALTAGVQANA